MTVSDAKNPPLELREIAEAKEADTGIVGYISFCEWIYKTAMLCLHS